MSASFYFYDLETSGISPRQSRIMQFAGQRTDLQLRPIAEPDNILIKLTDDVLPQPDAILITGITPQMTIADGITEAEFLRYFTDNIAIKDTIFTGFNTIRFDDEFMRFLHYRNFYDAYEWAWRDGRSRWDILDVVRMTRALRPDGIEWPFKPDGQQTNRLELLTAVNKLEHNNAHDALSDVNATIAVARLIHNKQPKLFEYLLGMRDKNKVKNLVQSGEGFVYTSGKYPSAYQKTTVAVNLGEHPGKQGSLIYDLRCDPEELVHLSPAELAVAWRDRPEDETKRFPVKTLQFNRCPAVAPIAVLDKSSQERLKIDLNKINDNHRKLVKYPDFYKNLLAAINIMDKQRQANLLTVAQEVDERLYDGFFNDGDRTAMSVVRAADSSEIGSLNMQFNDQRLNDLLPLYKARNYLAYLSQEEREAWEKHRSHALMDGGEKSQVSKFFTRLSELSSKPDLSSNEQYLLQELQLYGESILPSSDI